MELQRIVFQKLVIISFGMFIVAADIKIVHNSVNWIAARNECISQKGKLLNEEEFGICNNRTKGTNLWIGTHQILSPWLGKIGCFDLENTSKTMQGTGSVQECFSLCGTPFGYVNNVCFCILQISIKLIASSRCLVGYPSRSNIAWIYEANELNISNVDNLGYSGNCIGTRCTNRSSVLEVFNCSSKKKYLCQSGTHSTTTYSWEEAEFFCNLEKSDSSVTNLESICKHTDDAVQDFDLYWTGYKRYWYKSTSKMSTESIHSLSEVFNCSYMICPNDAATAIHKQGNCSQELNGYACLINNVPKTTSKARTKHQTTTESNADSSNDQHEGHITSTQIVRSRESKTTIMNSATCTSATLTKLAKKPSYIVIIVVLTVVAVAIVSSCVVLVICRVRRQGQFKRKEKETGSQMTEMHDPNYPDFENAPSNASSISHSNTAYNTHNGARYVVSDKTSNNIKSGTASNNEYSVVMKDKKSISGANEYNFDQKEENSSDIMDNEYDRLNQIKNPCDSNNKNIYDTTSGLRDEYDPTYNTTSQISGRNKDENSVYDHT